MTAAGPRRRLWRMVGADGYWALLLSTLVATASLGTTALISLLRVYVIAARTTTRPREIDGIVVFGHALEQGALSQTFAVRLERALALAHQFPGVPIILLGGQTTASRSEAATGRDYLLAQGLPDHRILLEEGSRYTLENLQQARRYLTALARPAFITSRYHLARVHSCATGMKLAHVPIAAEDQLTLSLPLFWHLTREAAYLHWYHVGRLWAELTRNQHSLERLQ